MRAIIPTAGVGKRLQPFTHTVPKVLLQVADRPILGHIVEKVVAQGIRDITFIVGHLGDQIQRFVTRRYPQVNAIFVEQAEPLGLGHAIYLGRDARRDASEPLLIVLGDTIIDADFSALQSADADLIGVREVDDPRHFGVVELDGEFISGMVEKPEHPKTNLAVVGVYFFRRPSILFECIEDIIRNGVKTRGEIQLTDAIQKMIEQGARMRSLKVSGWHDCGTPETLLSTNRDLLRERFMNIHAVPTARLENVTITPPVCIADTARVKDSIVGPDVTIADDAIVSGSIIRNTIINEGAQVHNARLTDSIIGSRALVRESALKLHVGDNSEVIFG
jgi:glucose-1-phosphate thymidylyltransferase